MTAKTLLRCAVAAASMLTAAHALAQAPAASAAAPAAVADTDELRIADLIDGNHILANERVLDGFGHISVRSVKNPKHYYMARSRGPGLVEAADIMEYDEDSQPVDQRGREMYSERFIHGEIYRARPDVQSVVHSHSPAVMPFTVTKTPFQALTHVSGFLGVTPVPVYEIRDVTGPENNMLIRDAKTGSALAKTLGTRAVALMRGHGMAVAAAGGIREAVFFAVYTQANARIEAETMRLGTPVFMNRFEVTRTERISRQWELWARAAPPAR